ncbi:hypothetical protein ESY86_03690 [Subsaximicrobium wynnwilliamsii]|uniref:Uncharacterized protein n=1 Tax=Subsaximicrobium wynnwilliamsii TaxID=291179 RepID=A0A5C6ZKX8_9FLAO|nr:hypothetical protein [Subsaximicrobium wynnwilliamsii]TXD84808.1 hypothetical protein ESY87_03470 [Subsaximicrobium wynnwilliamsii]TXD90479.1 hypothetical protein ESY86_03690 [Subsaximicrobium wynnwilliamsii]TXE04954.1 hypothetical protein ESY88_01995 [Subsaximicrobium wynnwilliamsii]
MSGKYKFHKPVVAYFTSFIYRFFILFDIKKRKSSQHNNANIYLRITSVGQRAEFNLRRKEYKFMEFKFLPFLAGLAKWKSEALVSAPRPLS